MIVDLTKMKTGSYGTVVNLEGGRGASTRLQNLGVRPGKKVRKISGHFWRGPVTVQIGGTNVALGFGMASKVMVEVVEEKHGK